MSQPEPRRLPRYGGYAGLLALLILVLITINTIVTKPNGVKGLAPGEQLPPFAVPLALGSLNGDADTATHADEGAAGRVPACKERGPQILNVCQLYEQAPGRARAVRRLRLLPGGARRHAGALGLVPGRALRGRRDQERPLADPPADPHARADACRSGSTATARWRRCTRSRRARR